MTNPDTSAEAVANPWALDEINARIASGDIDVDPIQTFPTEVSMRMEIEALSRDLEAMRAERDAAIARAEQAETRVAELEAERAEIGKASVALLDELVAYLSQNAPAHKEALAGLKTARAALSQEVGE